MKRVLFLVMLGVAALAVVGWSARGMVSAAVKPAAGPSDKDKPDPASVERARKEVHMLDGIYKDVIVLITDKYVNSPKDYPAGRAAVVLFRQITKGGSHEVRLLDVTGEPNNPKNVASDAFEEAGVKEIKAGKDYYDAVVPKNGKSYLRAMTAVPVVMDKCIMCHENYKKAKKGEAIGAISYSIPLE
jgi:hypothetical protein